MNVVNENQPADVAEVQEFLRLIAQTYPDIPLIAVDGIYGAETTAAVRAFQKLFGLPPTGEVNYETWNALLAEYRRLLTAVTAATPIFPVGTLPETIGKGDSGNLVYILQAMLDTIAQSFANLPPIAKTGEYNEATEEQVRQMQALFGRECTGQVDRATWDMLAQSYNTYVGR